MGNDPTQAYFWLAVNKGQARLWPRYFLTWPEERFFLTRQYKIWKKWAFLRKIFQIRRSLTQPKYYPNWVTNIFAPNPSVVGMLTLWPTSLVHEMRIRVWTPVKNLSISAGKILPRILMVNMNNINTLSIPIFNVHRISGSVQVSAE